MFVRPSEGDLYVRLLIRFVLNLDISLWFGSSVYFSLFAALELFHGFSATTASQAVGLLFPAFFELTLILAILGWVFYFTALRVQVVTPWARTGHLFMGTATLIAVLNRFYFLPAIQHLENQMGPIQSATSENVHKFGMLHGTSMMLELLEIILVVGIWLVLTRQSIGNRGE
jgi:Domain of unknown function (DUF4149)